MTKFYLVLTGLLCWFGTAYTQVAIGTATPDANAMLTIVSTNKGVLLPRLTSAQQAVLAASLTTTETGMLVTDAGTGHLLGWSGTAFVPAANVTATAPLSVSATNQVALNAGTNKGDLITWDGTNWVNMQPAVQHFSLTVDNRQPYLTLNYCIAMNGIFPSRSDATPFVSQIQIFPFNFAPVGWALCNGQLISISQNTALFSLLGTNYGGDGRTTFQLPNLQGRVSMDFGQGAGLSNYIQGQTGGTNSNTIAH
jgi:microcystin-dependent protein